MFKDEYLKVVSNNTDNKNVINSNKKMSILLVKQIEILIELIKTTKLKISLMQKIYSNSAIG